MDAHLLVRELTLSCYRWIRGIGAPNAAIRIYFWALWLGLNLVHIYW